MRTGSQGQLVSEVTSRTTMQRGTGGGGAGGGGGATTYLLTDRCRVTVMVGMVELAARSLTVPRI